MSKDLNQVRLKGHAGKEPELRILENGSVVAHFSIATNHSYPAHPSLPDSKTGEITIVWETSTTWHRITAWDKLANECARLIKKGTRVEITGYLKTSEWRTPDGRVLNQTEVTAKNVDILVPIADIRDEEEPEEEVKLDFIPEEVA